MNDDKTVIFNNSDGLRGNNMNDDKKPMDYDFWCEQVAEIVTFKDNGDKVTVDANSISELTGMDNYDIPLEAALEIMGRSSKGLRDAVRDHIHTVQTQLSQI